MIQRLLLSFLFISSAVYAEDRSAEVDAFVALYQGDNLLAQKRAVESLAWKGMTDERVYDEIQSKLLGLYNTFDDKLSRDAVSWFLMGLSFSGNDKYIPAIKTVRDNSTDWKHQGYAKSSLEDLQKYKVFNQIINDESRWDNEQTGEINRFANMIRSDDLELKRMAARRVITDEITSEYLLEIINADVEKNYTTEDKSKLFANTYGYMTKALAALGNGRYSDTVRRVAERGYSLKLRRYAQRYVKQYKL